MIYKAYKDKQISRLGMGCMRYPMKEGTKDIDWEESQRIIDDAIAGGINYFDTAYVYNAGESERCTGACLKKHDRASFSLATKYAISADPDYRKVFATQLERLQTDYIDFYLIHCLLDSNIDQYLESGAIEFFLEMKKEGKIRNLGFSSHASVETLRRFADHHQWDFAQLQINYFDYFYKTSREEYEVLAERNIPVMVMEPVRGGRLSELTPEAEAVLKGAHPEWSISSWALRFVRTLPAVQVILSGMSTREQMADNLSTFSDEAELSAEDMETLKKAVEVFHKNLVVPCTGCRYCTDGCPMKIDIPSYMSLYNTYKVEKRFPKNAYEKVESEGRPEDCISCGQCSSKCPQSIEIPIILAELSEAYSKLK